MATSFEHRALVEQLRALTQKRAENPGEADLNTSHPSGSNSAADDHTQAAVVGHRYSENTAANKAMYPKGPDSAAAIRAGSQQKDPGHNKGVKVRPTGEMPEVERKYNLGDHNDPGSSHPSAKAAANFIAEAQGLAAELRNLIKASAGKADTYVTGNVAEEATDDTDDNASGTSAYPQNANNDGNIPLTKEQGKDAAEKLAQIRQVATRELFEMREGMKESAATDAESFVQAVTHIMDKFAAPHVLPVLQAQKQAAEQAEIQDAATKIAIYDILAGRDGMPKFAEVMELTEAPKSPEKKPADKKPADKKPADKMPADKMSASRKRSMHPEMAAAEAAAEGEESEEGDESEEAAAEQVLAEMASAPAGGGAPDAGAADPASIGGMEGGEEMPPLSPEEEAALMQLIEQEGMKESDVKYFAKVSHQLSTGKLKPTKLSAAQVSFLQTCDGAVKRAGAKFQTLRSAGRLRNELNYISRGIQ